MSLEKNFLSLLVSAGRARYAIEATHVVEVAQPDVKSDTLHGHLHLKDLSALMGGSFEHRPGSAVVLDTSPTLALRVREVLEVINVSEKPRHSLPRRLMQHLSPIVAAVIETPRGLFFELDVELLHRGLDIGPPELFDGPSLPVQEESERSLVFESMGRQWALPLVAVSQVVAAGDRLCPLPQDGSLKGLILHQQHLWPVYSLPGLMGQVAEVEPLAVLVEVLGEGLGILASKACGVHERGSLQGAQVVDLQRLFS